MRFARARHDGRTHWVRVADDVVHLLSGSPIEDEPAVTGTVALSAVTLLPPVLPFVFYAVGLNYPAQLDALRARGFAATAPERAEVGYRANNALVGAGAAIHVPADLTGPLEAEGEVVAVIGRRLRRASRAEALASVFGWTIGNDVSARAWQRADSTFWRGKNSDTFKPMGPWIDTEVDPLAQTTSVRVNGVERVRFRTGDMIFDPFDYLVEASRYVTFHPGDVLWMGAGATCPIGVGDVVEVEITGIGTLANPVRAEPDP